MKLRLTLKNLVLGSLPIFMALFILSLKAASAYCIGTMDDDGNIVYFEGDDCF